MKVKIFTSKDLSLDFLERVGIETCDVIHEIPSGEKGLFICTNEEEIQYAMRVVSLLSM